MLTYIPYKTDCYKYTLGLTVLVMPCLEKQVQGQYTLQELFILNNRRYLYACSGKSYKKF